MLQYEQMIHTYPSWREPANLLLFVVLLFLFLLMQPQSVNAADPTILFLGDSLTAGFEVEYDNSFPALLGKRLSVKYTNIKIINGGISGSTTSSALSRLKWHIKSKPDILVLALGINDGLRGIPPALIKANLDKVIKTAIDHKIKVLLIGMLAPPNYGEHYTHQFQMLYQDLANSYKLPFYPFLLDGVVGNASLNLPDGVHPNAKGYAIIADKLYSHILQLL